MADNTRHRKKDADGEHALMNELRALNDKMDKMQTKMDNMQSNIETQMDIKINTLRGSLEKIIFDGQAAFKSELEKAVKEVRNNLDLEVSIMSSRMDDIETKMRNRQVRGKPFDPDVSLIIVGLPQADGENLEAKVKELLQDGLHCDPVPTLVATERVRQRGRQPGLVKVELASVEDKVAALRLKSKLKDHGNYRRVYVSSAKSHAERLMETNLRTLLREIPMAKDYYSDYKNLFTCNSSSHLFDDQFFLNMCKSKKLLEDNKISLNYSDKINQDITIEEVLKVIEKTKLHKAAGVDELSNEVLKCPKLLTTLHCLFRFCFKNGFIPSIWYKSIIKPIPKSPQADPRVPLNYRGISLLSTVYKVFSSILNNRLSEYLETNEVLVEEQNGFRRNRACIDNIYVLSSVVRARLQESKSTFVCFVDFKKAFDSIDRDLLQYKLLTYGINGQFYKAIKALYKAPLACVQVNDLKTGWFSTPFGVKQGDVLSPTLFSIYVNDLAQEIKKTNLGIDINNWNLSILLYADDIILIADEEIKLQGMLNTMNDWCNKWRLTINSDKTQIVHFRKPLVPQSNFLFYFGKTTLMYTDTYKYLGFVFHKNMMFSEGKQRLSDSAGRALGAVINKMKVCPELSLDTFSKLYDAMVGSVLFYSAGVWGYEDAPECDKVQYRAMRYFLGVHRFTTKAAVEGDMGWEPCVIKQRAEVLRLWNRLVTLPVERIARKIFDWDRAHMYPWCNDVFNILSSVNLQSLFFNCLKCKIDNVKETLVGYYEKDWKMKLLQKPKLRTYLQIKDTFSAESYVIYNLKRGQRSLCAQLRAGVLPLQVEVGRFKGIPEEERLCEVCELRVVEDEFHFLFYCPLYEKQRLCMYDVIEKKCPDLFWLSEDKILRWLFENEIFCLANFVSKAWIIRMDSMYSVRL
ncbi:uncharacterized protein LOC111947977 [Oryzias latipes]|uniref:uncharacterized protein LOC111947977 n=1 Tax=Oryzias latipes TaxID=8090 RepID=UPI000CE20055|nr:uncharacterized protein LOC111947977 [Oryzias latipes]